MALDPLWILLRGKDGKVVKFDRRFKDRPYWFLPWKLAL
ncbi:Unknown protein sequence [Pseudomonas syringae pv. maculicola str. M6]|nr:Unknown protein sequence [Pseudomonas syringae pv. maculicola str. M6]